MMSHSFITRFAPSPTGRLHLGHAFAAREAFQAAQLSGGICLLRIEDTDQTRCTPEFDQSIRDDLAWLGFSWPEPVRRQSHHMEEYHRALKTLIDTNLVYRCFRTRKEVMDQIASAPHAADMGASHAEKPFIATPLSPDEERERLASGAPYAWRLSLHHCKEYLGQRWHDLAFYVEEKGSSRRIAARADMFGDAILARKDTGTSYHLAVVHDDALQSVTHVVRGDDLFDVTHLHVLLQSLLNVPTPTYRFHRLICDDAGKRLAKRTGATAINVMRQNGMTPADIWAQLGF